MDRTEIAERMIVSRTKHFNLDAMIDKTLSDDDLSEVASICGSISSVPLNICDSANQSVGSIRAEALTTPGLELIIIDYLGLMRPEKKNDNRNLELGQISRDLKCMASELNIPVIALSQLNRQKSETDKPSMSDIRDSGEIEQNASKILMLWKSEDNMVACSVEKNRRGRKGIVQFDFDGSHMAFTENGIPYTGKSGGCPFD